ncbi:transmembrane gamma-carboxyglutamic acid protein 4-like isoform X1 [Megalops cyprinoides]|uniref:transmembrane gamma-carboxyglutamic acid protein 4-like isoform X1 n=1 Tax=Megalops cyprinoides TaxID=118141 RepID=UPI00186410F9|nr:transmembrane gamma-carboxyglutamic acid protein 4-like isoform X1 [Megalops cyprinoides]
MLLYLFLLCQFIQYGLTACTRRILRIINTEDSSNEVFVDEEAAKKFLGRHLLFNRFDFELFTPGNLERECKEEVCNYEEAREIFENIPATDAFWEMYTQADNLQPPSRLDVTALLIGLIAAGVTIIIIGLLFWYCCQRVCTVARSPGSSRVRTRRSNASLIIRRLEEVSMQPVFTPEEEMGPPGLPSYEQAIAKSGQHDAPPPPYPGSKPGSIRR